MAVCPRRSTKAIVVLNAVVRPMSDLPEEEERPLKPGAPFCWQYKAIRTLIRDHYDGDHFGASVLEVYTAMTEIASDAQSATFTTLQSHIAKKSCLGVTTIKKALPALRALAVIAYHTPKLRGPITFTLLAARRLPLAATRPALAKTRFQCNLATVEEYIEESQKNDNSHVSPKRSSCRRPPLIQLVDDDHLRALKQLYRPGDVDKAVADCKAWLLTPRGKGKVFTKRRLQTFLRDAEPLTSAAPPSDARDEIDRDSLDPEGFRAFLAREYPAGIEKGWTAANAPERIVRNFIKETVA